MKQIYEITTVDANTYITLYSQLKGITMSHYTQSLRSLIFPAPNKKRSIRYLLFRLVVLLENFFFFELLCKFFNSF